MEIRLIDINPAGINVISSENDAVRVTQLGLNVQENDISNILGNDINNSNYKFDKRVVYALSMGETDLLNNYINICKNVANKIKKSNIDINAFPQIMYDLKGIKDSFEDIEDIQERRNEQISLYEDAKQTKSMFKYIGYKDKVTVRAGVRDTAYITIQKFIQNSRQTEINRLGDGHGSKASTFRAELHKDEYTQGTNRISSQYDLNQAQEQKKEEKEEISL